MKQFYGLCFIGLLVWFAIKIPFRNLNEISTFNVKMDAEQVVVGNAGLRPDITFAGEKGDSAFFSSHYKRIYISQNYHNVSFVGVTDNFQIRLWDTKAFTGGMFQEIKKVEIITSGIRVFVGKEMVSVWVVGIFLAFLGILGLGLIFSDI